MSEHTSRFDAGDYVHVDGDKGLTFAVTGVLFRKNGVTYELSWIAGGAPQSAWVEEWRCSPTPKGRSAMGD